MKQTLRNACFVMPLLAMISDATAQIQSDAAKARLSELTSAALLDQIKCQHHPEVSHAVNAMTENHLIRYLADESGTYLFVPTVPLTFLGLKIAHVSGFDYDGFKRAPVSTMAGTAPPVFIELDVVAPAGELRKRALDAGLTEEALRAHKHGFEISAQGWGSYLAPKTREQISSIRCVDNPDLAEQPGK